MSDAARLSDEEVRAIRAIGENAGCMALKGASAEHEGAPHADRWSLDGALAAVAARWGIDPGHDLIARELSSTKLSTGPPRHDQEATAMSIDVSAIKQGQKMMWAAGNYPEVARRIESVAEVLVERVGAAPGLEMLDVATGSGNVAIPAAQAGASVTGLDLTPELLEAARRRAVKAGVDVRWIEGDAEELPFESDSFDRVTSCFGVMFAPRHEQAASELARVARPGATIAVTAWTPEGLNGQMFKTVGSYMPAPPPELKPPVMWGEEEHVRSLMNTAAPSSPSSAARLR